ncbi:LysR family transcriptional regulator [Azorhizobium doebereinerae]|uniref:LysR family transcriptional regulator n=1 Tax=Azorhizobium doebereinerae TaxID=281091 RepID=UPI000400D814|nr:LysR family transcriptional regulator [Azorhizobium doebereinerae]
MDIDINHIRRVDGALLLVFRELMATGQTTAAARRLGLTQSTVSHALRRLRDLMGDPLFQRRPDGLTPTPRARELLPIVVEMLRLSEALKGAPGDFDPAASTRHFRLAGPDLVSTVLAGPFSQRLRQEAPNARLSFRFLAGQEALDALTRGEVDMAIGDFPAVPHGFAAAELWAERYVAVARQGHPRFPPLDLAGYLAADHLVVSFTGRFTGAVDAVLQARGLSRRVVAALPLGLAVFDAVAWGDAVATVSGSLAVRHAAAFGLEVLPLPVDVPGYPMVSVRRAGSPDAGYEWLEGLIRRMVAEYAPERG